MSLLKLLQRPKPALGLSLSPRHRLLHSSSAIERRLSLWDEIFAQKSAEEQAKSTELGAKITLKTGHVIEAAGKVTPLSILKEAVDHDPNAKKSVVAKLNGQLWDLSKQIPTGDSTLEYLTFEDPEGQNVFWHSSAHVLGQALETIYGEKLLLCDGPPIKQGGFFYEFAHPTATVSESDLPEITKAMQEVIKRRDPFQRMTVSSSVALQLFQENSFKKYFIEKASQQSESISLYRCGRLIDFCRGPHVLNTGVVKAIEATKVSGAYWLGNTNNEQLQRVYGISFPSTAEMKKWHADQEEAKKRDHRVIGKNQKLFMMHSMSPGSVFLLPHGTIICNKLTDFLRKEYKRLDFQEVQTPLIYKKDLWVQSGHWDHYKDDMFLVTSGKAPQQQHSHDCGHSHDGDQEVMGLKPMNCPGHCLIFGSSAKSYRDLPLRLADFSALHRNEISGALSGLTRVRKFHQDDAHIFCMPSQIGSEVDSCLKFIERVYSVFGFDYSLTLSTRPEKYMGELHTWNKAEESLKAALQGLGRTWTVSEGDGAFYGPKIDVIVKDALGRSHQTATIQLDFQLPERFGLNYTDNNGEEKTPVIIHRAILGSVERMFGILIEHTAGKWPFWLSPRQVCVIPVSKDSADFSSTLAQQIKDAGYSVEHDNSDETLNKRIRNAQLAGFNFIAVIGHKEKDSNSVAIRERQEGEEPAKQRTSSIPDFMAELESLTKNYK